VLGDFSGKPAQPHRPLKDRKFVQIDRVNFDEVMARMTPGLEFQVANSLKGDGSQLAVKLFFNSLEDFEPGRVVQQVEPLKELREARDKLSKLVTRVDRSDELESLLEAILKSEENIKQISEQIGVGSSKVGPGARPEQRLMGTEEQQRAASYTPDFHRTVPWPTTPPEQAQRAAPQAPAAAAEKQEVSLLERALLATEETERSGAEELLKALLDPSLAGACRFDKNVTRTINARFKAIDLSLSKQLCAIMHHPLFQRVEGTWRGLHHLVWNSETNATLKIKILNVSKRELYSDLDKAVEFDQSQIFKKLYEDEFSILGGEPFGTLVGDFEFSNHPEDIDLLSKLSNVAAAAYCPFISAADPKLFGFESWQDFCRLLEVEKIFMTTEYTKWNSFRDSEDSRFVVLVMPRVLARMPYGTNTTPIEEFGFDELDDTKPVSRNDFTWMNAAYVLGCRLTESFAKYGSCTAILGAEGGGKVEGLPTFLFTSVDGDMDLKCPTEIGITDCREGELSRWGSCPCAITRTPTTPCSWVARQPRDPENTTGRKPRPTRRSRRGFPTSWRHHGLPTTSR
jgi:type VI secretion system protein ImpC